MALIPFHLLADYLNRHGIATLCYNKRGVMRSTGDFSKATLWDFIQNASEGFSYLRNRKDIAYPLIAAMDIVHKTDFGMD